MNQKELDERYMRRCLQLAVNGKYQTRPNPMVGAVIVYDDRIIGEETILMEKDEILAPDVIELES